MQLSPSVERFSKEIERARREDIKELAERGIEESQLNERFFLERLMDKFKILVEVVNESTSRSEVIKHAAVVANIARQIAQSEWENYDGKTDVREVSEGL